MSLDKPDQAASNSEQGQVSERPGCVTAYAVLLFIGGGLGLLLPFLYAFGPSEFVPATQNLIVASIRAMINSAISIAIAVGLWRLQRWSVGLVIVNAVFGLGRTLYGISTSAATSGVPVILCGALLPLLSLIIPYWFFKNRTLFNSSPSLDRWIVLGGAIVLAVVFVVDLTFFSS